MQFSRHPGPDYRYIICDVCGKKFRVKDTVKIQNKYSRYNNMIVCKNDVDVFNPQRYPYKLPKDIILSNPTYVRTETAEQYAAYPDNNILPGPPKNVRVQIDLETSYLYLLWDAPEIGSAPIIGYKITQAYPQYTYQFTIVENTNNAMGYYLDTTSNPALNYSYQVIAISEIGEGPPSDFALWLFDPNVSDIYITTDSHLGLTTDNGEFIILWQ